MGWVSLAAVFFIVWWLVLFAVLPFSLRTQEEDGDITLGTVESAPAGPHVARAMIRATIVTAILMAIYVYLTRYAGYSLDDLTHFGPGSGS